MTSPTDWTIYEVPTLAAFLDTEHRPAYIQVIAWNTAHDAITDAATKLTAACAELAQMWSPERSAAAAVFFEFVDELVTSMHDTAAAASVNGVALGNTLSALDDAKRSVDLLHAEWKAYAAHSAMPGHTEQQEAAANGDDWANDLNSRAQQHMATADNIIFDNARALIVPTTFQPGVQLYQPEPITIPTTASSRRTISSTSTSEGDSTSDITPVLAGGIGIDAVPGTFGAGSHDDNLPIPATGAATTGSASTDPAGILPIPTPPSVGGIRSPIREYPGARRASLGGTGSSGVNPSANPAARESAMSKGLIGIAATAEGDGLGASTSSASASGAGSPTQGSTMFTPGMTGRFGDGGARGSRRQVRRTMWELPTGVRSVISAAADLDVHDPGLGVIGIDR